MSKTIATFIGEIFNRLTIKSIICSKTVECVCRCGNLKTTKLYLLRSGHTKSCGCIKGIDVVDQEVEGVFFKSVFNGNFGVSECGKVIGRKGKVLNGRSQGHYLIVSYSLLENGKVLSRNKYVHRLVAEMWVVNNNPELYNIVNHKDGNKFNNNRSNLEWVTYGLNTEHALRTGLLTNMPSKGQCGFQKTKGKCND
jgi:hypothetical protein